MNKYFIYARKSSEDEERQILSRESQINELKLIVQKLSLKVVSILQESKSAKTPGIRNEFNQMLEEIRSGKADSILVWHPDRLSRNAEDSAKLITLIDSGHLLEVRTPTQVFTCSPMDKFMLGFFMMNAKLENDSKGVNVKRGLKAKSEMGWLPSGAKPGYANDKWAEKGNKTIVKDPDRFILIQKAWE